MGPPISIFKILIWGDFKMLVQGCGYNICNICFHWRHGLLCINNIIWTVVQKHDSGTVGNFSTECLI